MRIVVLGASGKTGKEVVNLAIKRGHNVTAVTRTPETYLNQSDVKAIRADVTSSSQLAKVFKNQDAVLSTLGSNSAKLQLIERSSKAIVEAMHSVGVRRLVVELAFGGAESATLTKPTRFLINAVLGRMLKDQKAGVKIIKKSDLDWTIIYATILTNKHLSEKVRFIQTNEKIGLKHKISRADVAFVMIKSVEDNTNVKKMPIVATA